MSVYSFCQLCGPPERGHLISSINQTDRLDMLSSQSQYVDYFFKILVISSTEIVVYDYKLSQNHMSGRGDKPEADLDSRTVVNVQRFTLICQRFRHSCSSPLDM
ncbi:hypothetical protein RRG08_065847 [Elysia crispata]|uniref:Uncharacterized protein n=1 Tax=Elysia crispata TaxID=231223 RepID=A0AAE0ZB03_9GAST|nr:hypothetical protein RRG08_065847 [Elysia crispata]